jgi:hypothetical protein
MNLMDKIKEIVCDCWWMWLMPLLGVLLDQMFDFEAEWVNYYFLISAGFVFISFLFKCFSDNFNEHSRDNMLSGPEHPWGFVYLAMLIIFFTNGLFDSFMFCLASLNVGVWIWRWSSFIRDAWEST